MKTKLAIAISGILALSACDDSLTDDLVGNSIGSVAISGDEYIGTTISADITEADGFSEEGVTYTWMADDTIIAGAISGSYLITADETGKVISVKVNYVDNAGNDETSVSSATKSVRELPVESAGSIAILGDAYIGLELTAVITDENGSGDTAISYQWMADGVAIADADNSTYLLTVDELNKTMTVSATYIDNDEFEEDVMSNPTDAVIEKPAEVITSQVAKITDTMGVGIGDGTKDTGELRYKLSDNDLSALETGMLSLSFRKEANAVNNNPNDSDTDFKDAYIGIFGSKVSTGYELLELRVQEGKYVVRGQEGTIDPDETFTGDEWVDIDITWDASGASGAVAPLMTLAINGVAVSADAFPTYDSGKSDGSLGSHFETIMDGVQYLVFKIGDNDATIATAFYLDDIKLYSDLAGKNEVFSDDFEAPAYAVGDSLDSDNANSPYNSTTNEVVVAEVVKDGADDPIVPEEPVIPEVDNLQLAEITDTMGTGIGDGTKDTGELRLKLSENAIDTLVAGKMVVSFKKEANSVNNNPNDTDTDNKDAYIGLFGSKVGTGFELIELRVQADTYVIRGQEGIVDVTEAFTPDQWIDLEITWDASNASASKGPLMTLALNGTEVSSAAFPTYDSGKVDGSLGSHFETIMAGVEHVVFKIGDNDATIATSFYIDDIKIYSDVAGTTEVFSDNFEASTYAVGESLDSDNDNSPYNSSTNEAVVADRL